MTQISLIEDRESLERRIVQRLKGIDISYHDFDVLMKKPDVVKAECIRIVKEEFASDP